MNTINRDILEALNQKAQTSKRKRQTHNFHADFNDPINRMLNAIEPGSYVQPHKHENPDKREVFLLLKGKLAAIFFDDTGAITEHIILQQFVKVLGGNSAMKQ